MWILICVNLSNCAWANLSCFLVIFEWVANGIFIIKFVGNDCGGTEPLTLDWIDVVMLVVVVATIERCLTKCPAVLPPLISVSLVRSWTVVDVSCCDLSDIWNVARLVDGRRWCCWLVWLLLRLFRLLMADCRMLPLVGGALWLRVCAVVDGRLEVAAGSWGIRNSMFMSGGLADFEEGVSFVTRSGRVSSKNGSK